MKSSRASSSGCSTGCAVFARLPWKPFLILVVFGALALGFASGCGRTVLVPESSPFRIGPGTKARIYAMTDGEWTLSSNSVEIPEGWYCVPPSFVEEEAP